LTDKNDYLSGGDGESKKTWSRDQQVPDDGGIGRDTGGNISDRCRCYSQVFLLQY